MGRKRIEAGEKHKRINVSIDKSVYFYLKEHKIKVSTYINQMLRLATGVRSSNNTNYTNYTQVLNPPKLEIVGSNPTRSVSLSHYEKPSGKKR